MDPSDQHLFDTLLEGLADVGAVTPDADTVRLDGFPSQTEPMRLHLTPASLGEHLRHIAPRWADTFPLLRPVEAASVVFLLHVMTAVEKAGPGDTDLVVTPEGLVSRLPRREDAGP